MNASETNISVHNTDNLGEKVAYSSALQFFGKISIRGLKFLRTIVIARLLFPEDIGLFVLASLGMGFVDLFIQSGFQAAIVQRDVVKRKHLDGAWTVHVIKGVILGVTMVLLSGPIAVFFENPMLAPLIKALSLMLVLDGFVNMGTVLLQKEFQFKKKLFYELSYVLTEIVAVIIAAIYIGSVWALVIGALVGRLASLAFSYVFHPYRPRFTLNLQGALELFHFGKWVWLTGIVTFFVTRADIIAVGKITTAAELGFYQLALSLALLPALEIVRSLGVVFLPLYSRIKNDTSWLTAVFLKISRVLFAIVVPVSVILAALAEPIIELLYGERWLPMVPVLQLLVIFGFAKSFEYLLTPVFLGMGIPRSTTITMLIQGISLAIFLVPLTVRFGIEGAAMSLILSVAISNVAIYTIMYLKTKLDVLRVIFTMLIPILAGAVMYASLFYIQRSMDDTGLLMLPLFIVCGVLVYFAVLCVLDYITGKHMWHASMWLKKQFLKH